MNKQKANRLLFHIFFWVIYFSITFFNEFFLTSDFAGNHSFPHLVRIFFCELNLLIIKMLVVYYALYSFLPRWLGTSRKLLLVTEAVCTMFLILVVYRGVIYYINWGLILRQESPAISFPSMLARFLYSFLEIVQVLAICIMIRLFRLRISSAENEKELIREKMKAELGHLKSQIHPHFLFNMLNSIYSLSRAQSPQTPEVVLRLSSLLRFMLYESSKDLVRMEEEMKIIYDFMDMQELRFEGRVKIERNYETDNPDQFIAPLLLFPFVENAFKHGIGSRSDSSFIYLDVTLKKGRLCMNLQNLVMDPSVQKTEDHGIGLTNIKKQLELLYGSYSLDAEEKNGVFTVDLMINLETYAGNELFSDRR